MVKFLHTLHIDDVSGKEIISLQYTGELPFPPSDGLEVSLSMLVSFAIEKKVTYSVKEKIYKSDSIVSFDPLDHEPGEESLLRYIAKYLKNGFEIRDPKDIDEKTIARILEYSHSKLVLA